MHYGQLIIRTLNANGCEDPVIYEQMYPLYRTFVYKGFTELIETVGYITMMPIACSAVIYHAGGKAFT